MFVLFNCQTVDVVSYHSVFVFFCVCKLSLLSNYKLLICLLYYIYGVFCVYKLHLFNCQTLSAAYTCYL